MKAVHIISFILLVVGGLNWGAVGVAGYDVVTNLLGEAVAQIVFILVGLAAVVELVTHRKSCKTCPTNGSAQSGAAM